MTSIPTDHMNIRSSSSAWLPLPQRCPDADLRLVCFPHAGAGANIFGTWADAFSPSIAVCSVEYPGRWSRQREPALRSLSALVDSAAVGLRDVLHGRFAFFGYSFGGLVSFELARALRRAGLPAPEHVFAAATAAPQLRREHLPIHHLADDAFLVEIERRYGAFPAEIRSEPLLLAAVLPALRADLTAFETYEYKHEKPLEIPITTFMGSADLSLAPQHIESWRTMTSAAFSSHVLPGDHFVLNRSASMVQNIIRAGVFEAGT